jgi:hypothetical protein
MRHLEKTEGVANILVRCTEPNTYYEPGSNRAHGVMDRGEILAHITVRCNGSIVYRTVFLNDLSVNDLLKDHIIQSNSSFFRKENILIISQPLNRPMHIVIFYYRHKHYNPTREQLPQTHIETALIYQDPRAHTATFILNHRLNLHLPRHNSDDH